MAYGDKDPRLDRTVAFVMACLLAAVLIVASALTYNNQQSWAFEREAVKLGYCHVPNSAGSSYYHWEKCQPAGVAPSPVLPVK